MKTIEILNARRSTVEANVRSILSSKAESKSDRTLLKKLYKELELLKLCKYYLETSPSEDFLRETLVKIQSNIEIHSCRAAVWASDRANLVKFKDSRAAIKGYLKSVDVPGLKARVATLRYLLGN